MSNESLLVGPGRGVDPSYYQPPRHETLRAKILEEATKTSPSPELQPVPYRFDEDKLIEGLRAYVDSTYDGYHYGSKVQVMDLLVEQGLIGDYSRGNVVKYAMRYGKKGGKNRADLMKMLHYGLFALYAHDREMQAREPVDPA
jgi:Protein of unknwon function (DUF3310)